MIILVDYDNIDNNITRHGITNVINRIISKIDPSDVDISRRITVRLYGGWYEENRATQKAQTLNADISANYPNTAILSDSSTSVIINCEIAYSILADPTNHLFSTFRIKGIPSGLKASHPSSCGCSSTNCPIEIIHLFLKNGKCPNCNTVKPSHIFYRGEQKLVDTMLTSDLIFSAQSPVNLVVVSSDDDFWPGIKTTLSSGKKVIHIHTRARATPTDYTRTTKTNYIQKQL